VEDILLVVKHRSPAVLLLTGQPGVGKTTLIRRVAEALDVPARGFTTEEIRIGRQRVGFGLETLGGERSTLAHVELKSPSRVGRYGVDLGALEYVATTALVLDSEPCVYLVDEIGKMECLSPVFSKAIETLLESPRLLVATIAARGTPFIEGIKRREGVELWTVTRDNRDRLPTAVVDWVRARLGGA
jgi:nucleoside-triphosphatase